MPLRKHKASIKFTNGIQGKVDHKILPKEHLVTLENGRFDKIGAINKRSGWTILDQASSDLVDYKGSLISRNFERSDRATTGILHPASVLAYGSQKFIGDKGYSDGIDYTMVPVSKGSEYRQEDSNTAFSSDGKWACVTFVDVSWDQANNKAVYDKRVSILDRETNALVISDLKVGTAVNSGNNGRRIRPMWLDSKFYIFGEDEKALKYWILDPTEADPKLKDKDGAVKAGGVTLLAAGNDGYPLSVDSNYATTVASFDACNASTSRYAHIYTSFLLASGPQYQTRWYVLDTDDHSFSLKATPGIGVSLTNGSHLKIHRAGVSGTHANKISTFHQDGTSAKISTAPESVTTSTVSITTTLDWGLGASNVARAIFRDCVNPLHTSDQDVQIFLEYGYGAPTGATGQFVIAWFDNLHAAATGHIPVFNSKFITQKGRMAFVMGSGPCTVGFYHDDNPTANTDVSDAPINTISLCDTDTNDNPNRFSRNVTNNANAATNMLTGHANPAHYTVSGSNEKLTITFDPPLIYASHVKFFQIAGTSLTFAINGGVFSSTGHTDSRLITAVSGAGELTKLEFYKSGGTMAVNQILIDDVAIIDEILPMWERDHLPVSTFVPDWLPDAVQSASVTGAAAHLNGTGVSIPVGHSFDRFGTAGTLVLNSTTHLFDFRRYNEERVDVPAPSRAMLHDILYVADKGLFQYDGEKFHTVGFLDRPMIGATLVTDTGNLSNGVYYYKAVYEWVDAQGNLHQSEPSDAVTVTTDGSNEKVTIDIADLDLGSHFGLQYKKDVRLALYRTQVGGSLYNHLTTISLGIESTTYAAGSGILTFVDNIADATAGTGKFLYTDSGELANKQAPFSARYVVAHRDRLFIIGKSDVVYYSKLASDGFGIGFNEALYIKTPDNISDPPNALGSMDGNLFIFTERSIFLVGGEGPDNLGSGGFYEAKRIPSPSGAMRNSPVKLINEGLLFVSQNKTGSKIWLLGRNMQVSYIGASVEEALNPTGGTPYIVRDIVSDPKQDLILFLLSQVSGTPSGVKMLTYNQTSGQWGVDVLEGTHGSGAGGSIALSSIALDKQMYIGIKEESSQDPITYVQSTSYADDGEYIPMKVKTAWINLAGIQSYQRAYAFHILGESKDATTLTVNVYYDYDSTTLPATNTYTFSASGAGDLQFRGLLSKQKCQAIQFEIVDSDNSGSTDSGYTLSEVAIELGLRSDGYRDSHAKLSSTSTIGSNS